MSRCRCRKNPDPQSIPGNQAAGKSLLPASPLRPGSSSLAPKTHTLHTNFGRQPRPEESTGQEQTDLPLHRAPAQPRSEEGIFGHFPDIRPAYKSPQNLHTVQEGCGREHQTPPGREYSRPAPRASVPSSLLFRPPALKIRRYLFFGDTFFCKDLLPPASRLPESCSFCLAARPP